MNYVIFREASPRASKAALALAFEERNLLSIDINRSCGGGIWVEFQELGALSLLSPTPSA
jgi:hypothetical protein